MNARFQRALCFTLCIGFLATTIQAQDSSSAAEAILKPWNEAVDRYQKAKESATSVLVRQLEAAEEKARSAGDLDKVNAIKQERKLLLEDGISPTSVKAATYEKAIDTAKGALRNAAQKTKAALVKQRFDDEALMLDKQLAELVGGTGNVGTAKPGPVAKPADGRVYWRQKDDTGKNGNEFRLLKPGEWVETTGVKTRKIYHWIEIARTPEYVELQDKERNFGMRLKSGNADVAYEYKKGAANGFGGWTDGTWVLDSPDVIYLSDLPEKSFKVWHYQDNKDFGWGKNGQLLDEGKTSLFYLENRPSPKGLVTVPKANDLGMVRYDISRLRREIFRCRFGIADLRRSNPASPVTFVVLGDGEKLFTSKPVGEWGVAHDCEVKIRNVKELELRVECPGPADLAYAVWYEPRLSNK